MRINKPYFKGFLMIRIQLIKFLLIAPIFFTFSCSSGDYVNDLRSKNKPNHSDDFSLFSDSQEEYIVILNKGLNLTESKKKLVSETETKIMDLGVSVMGSSKGANPIIKISSKNAQEIEAIEKLDSVAYVVRNISFQHFSRSQQNVSTGVKRVGLAFSSSLYLLPDSNVPTIGIIDAGVDPEHDDLNVVESIVCDDFECEVGNTDIELDENRSSHGTHVAGIAAAKDNQSHVLGTAPGAKIWSLNVFDGDTASYAAIYQALNYIIEHPEVDSLNLSLGALCNTICAQDPSYRIHYEIFQEHINEIRNLGIPVVVAAGNESTDARNVIPASIPEAITVSAIADRDGKIALTGGQDDTYASFSNYGELVDIAAPGYRISSTDWPNRVSYKNGTSMAAPHVAGIIAGVKMRLGSVDINVIEEEFFEVYAAPYDSERAGLSDPGVHTEPVLARDTYTYAYQLHSPESGKTGYNTVSRCKGIATSKNKVRIIDGCDMSEFDEYKIFDDKGQIIRKSTNVSESKREIWFTRWIFSDLPEFDRGLGDF